jgi:predicted membrane-bound mannosyltransferase
MGWAEFWDATPYATRVYLTAWAERERAANERVIVGAFHAAYFTRFEKLGPKDLEKALGRTPKPSKQQTEQDIGRAVFAWLKASEPHDGTARH